MNMYQDTREDAIKYIKQSDAKRANYYKTITGEKWGNKHLYDLCINTKLGAEQAAGAVLHYLKK
jgi:hypothetical protein